MSADDSTPLESPASHLPHAAGSESAPAWRPIGFRGPATTGATATAKPRPARTNAAPRRSQPLSTRPKGRFFTGLMIIALLAVPAYSLWSGYLQYPARGVVRGRVVRVSPPWQGTVSAVHVREGDEVRQGQPILSLRKLELEHQLDAIADQLRVAQAELKARAAELIWRAELRGDRSYQAWGEYYEAWGDLMQEQARWQDVLAERNRLESVHAESALTVSDLQLDHARFAAEGQQAKVAKLVDAVKQFRLRAEMYEQQTTDVAAQMDPQLTNIENLQAELARLRQRMDAGVLRAPVNGRVVRILRFAGETADPLQPAIEIVEDGSVEVVIYLPQHYASQLQRGDAVEVSIEPNDRRLSCVIQRCGDRLEPPPSNLQRHFARHARLLPVIAKPSHFMEHLYLGSEVKLSWSSLLFAAKPLASTSGDASSDEPPVGETSSQRLHLESAVGSRS